MGTAVDLVVILVWPGKVGAYETIAEVGGIVEATKLGEVVPWIDALALGFESSDSKSRFSHTTQIRR